MQKTFLIALILTASGLPVLSQSPITINACVNNLNGVPRLVASSTNCVNNVETFRQWSITGAQGPAGAQGHTGPTGPTGAAGTPGGHVFLGNQQFPATISQLSGVFFPLVGASTPLPAPASSMMARPPDACLDSQKFSATVLNAPGTSTMNVYLLTGIADSPGLSFATIPLCNVTANSGSTVSCTGATSVPLGLLNLNFLGLYVTADAGFQGATVISTLTCP